MPIGEVNDLIACYQIAHGAKQKQDEPDIFDLVQYR